MIEKLRRKQIKSDEAAFAGKAVLGGNRVNDSEKFTGEKGSIASLAASLPKLEAGGRKRVRLTDMIATDNPYTGNHFGLVGVVIAADRAVGLVAEANRTTGKPKIHMVELPFGDMHDGSVRASRQLHMTDVSQLDRTLRRSGTHNVENVYFGRAPMADRYARDQVELAGNDEISRRHFMIAVEDDGAMNVFDQDSTNGTTVITSSDLRHHQDNPQLQGFIEHLSDPKNELQWTSFGDTHPVIAQ